MFFEAKKILTIKLTILAILALIIGGCTLVPQTSASTYDQFKERVGADTVNVIQMADRISIAAVLPDDNRNVIISSKEDLLTLEQVKTLKKILLQDEGYHFDRRKRCLFIPTVAFRFGDNQEVTVMVGTTCKQIKVISPEKAIILDYDPMEQVLNAFCETFVSE